METEDDLQNTVRVWSLFFILQILLFFIVYEVGGTKTAYTNLFYVSICLIAIKLGMKSGAFAGLFSGITAFAVPGDVYLGLIFDLKNLLIKLSIFIFIGAVTGYISDALKKQIHLLKKKNYEMMYTLVRVVDSKDAYTSKHSVNVSNISIEIAKILKFENKFIQDLEFASNLHDIGKIAVPDYIINKPDKLNGDEYEIIKKHPEEGADIIKSMFKKEIIEGIKFHHERFDGKGYPNGLKGEEIPMIARIIHIADAIDAMLSDRAYRKALPVIEAIEEISKNAGSQFDQTVSRAAVQYLRKIDSCQNKY
jgi:putative nucleotidyltransferase with HDIG domain